MRFQRTPLLQSYNPHVKFRCTATLTTKCSTVLQTVMQMYCHDQHNQDPATLGDKQPSNCSQAVQEFSWLPGLECQTTWVFLSGLFNHLNIMTLVSAALSFTCLRLRFEVFNGTSMRHNISRVRAPPTAIHFQGIEKPIHLKRMTSF